MKIVEIDSILFSGKKTLPWSKVEDYLSQFNGLTFDITETGDRIIVGSHFASEYCGSNYTKRLHGTLEKAKANAVQVIPDLIQNASNRRWTENKEDKHRMDARLGWYRYDVFFSIQVIFEGKKGRNVYRGTLVARINDSGIYLHDLINIKKEDSKPFES